MSTAQEVNFQFSIHNGKVVARNTQYDMFLNSGIWIGFQLSDFAQLGFKAFIDTGNREAF